MNIDDDTLILYIYNDGLSAEQRLCVENALRDDQTVARRHRDLAAGLAALRADDEAIEAPAAAVHRWQTGLARAARVEASKPGVPSPWRLWLGGAIAAVAVLAVGLSMRTSGPAPDEAPFVLAPPAADRLMDDGGTSSSLRRGIQVHLIAAAHQLDQLPAMDAARQAEVIAGLIGSNRAYQRAADDQKADRLARALRAFEPGLRSLAAADTDSPTFRAERERLTFELGIVHARLAHPSRA
jgi:hypothetical protein